MFESLCNRLMTFLALRWRRWASARVRESPGEVLSAARITMRRKKYCVLATLGDATVDARVVQPFAPDRHFTVWLGTRRGSRKHEQILRNPAATLAYQDDARGACAVLVGRVAVVEDISERRVRFKPFWHAFWPEGPEAADFVLLRFVPSRIEVWDAWRRITPAPFGLKAAALVRGVKGDWVRA